MSNQPRDSTMLPASAPVVHNTMILDRIVMVEDRADGSKVWVDPGPKATAPHSPDRNPPRWFWSKHVEVQSHPDGFIIVPRSLDGTVYKTLQEANVAAIIIHNHMNAGTT